MTLLLAISVPTGWVVVGLLALALMGTHILGGIFGPTPRYQITGAEELPANDSAQFLTLLESLVDAQANRTGNFDILTNGPCFYPAALDAIRGAQRSVNLEAYVFHKSKIARLYVEALAERARAGVHVNVVLDAFGSMTVPDSFFRPLVDAGGKVARYNALAWYRLLLIDNRTHRELLIVDGRIGFLGGAGIADQWYTGVKQNPRWRDTMVCVEGEAVPNLQATFSENWLAASGELLVGEAYFPHIDCPHPTTALVVNSTPTVGGSTRARVLFQLLLASARETISITTPYFLPDKSLMQELCRAIDRGVRVRVLVPGRKSDHLLTRSTSRGGYGALLRAGAEVYEYQPSMIHAKVLCVDGLWTVVGSTNFDNRSFGINDEVNLAVRDAAVARRLESDFKTDLRQSQRVSLEDWRRRPVSERATELLGWVFERQQ
ncbi:MAG TPA: phospholipase D-like domain-containing protein [Terracidiphilus sp.]|jgi:cardiolipin synthase|nr:phospholipase D-like domain-containing protein [Terracidiphilus sp.]